VYVTGAFGLACASHVVNTLTRDLIASAKPAQSKFETQRADVRTAP
jgi:hypothetical protein